MREFDHTKPAITAKHHEENCVGLQASKCGSHHEMPCIATSARPTIQGTFANLWYPPTRSVESRFLTSDPSMYRSRLQSLRSRLARGFCDCGLFPVWRRCHPSGLIRTCPFKATAVRCHDRVCGSTHRWAGYVSSDFEESCFSRYVGC
jgi:hypothetical protein